MEAPIGIGFGAYYKTLWWQFWRDVRRDVASVVIAIIGTVFVALLQTKFGLLRTDQKWLSAAVNAAPYALVLMLFVIYHGIHAPWRLAQASGALRDIEFLDLKEKLNAYQNESRRPVVSAMEQKNRDKVLALIAGASTESLEVLKVICERDEINANDLYRHPSLKREAINGAVTKWVHLLMQCDVRAGNATYFSIVSGLKNALIHILSET